MRVRCRNDVYEGDYAGYIPGVDLLVVEISIESDHTSLRVEHPTEQSPYLLDIKFVEVVSSKIPSNWVIYPCEGYGPDLTARSWAREDYWRAYYDGEPWAEELYANEVAIMRAEDPLPDE